MVDLLIRLGRKPELERLRQSDTTNQLEQIEAMAFYRHGDKKEASRIIQQSLGERPGGQSWQVEMLEVLGEAEKAESVLRTVAEQSNTLEPWLALLRSQVAHGKPQVAAETITEIKRRIRVEQPELLESRCRWAAGDWSAADRAFFDAVERYPNVPNVQTLAARYFEDRGRRDRAEECLRRVLAQNPNDRSVKRQIAILVATQGGRSDAWKQALELLGPEQPETEIPEERLARAIVLAQSKDQALMKQSRGILEALAADVPVMSQVGVSAREMLARLLLAAGQPGQASRVIEGTATLRNDPTLVALYAEALLQSRDFSVLEKQLDRLAMTNAGKPYEASLRARMIQKQQAPSKAVATLEDVYLTREGGTGGEQFGREAFPLLLAMGPEALETAERLGRRMAGRNPVLSWMPAQVLANRGDRMGALALCQAAAQSPGGLLDLIEACRIALGVAAGARNDTQALEKADQVFVAALAHAPDADGLLVMKAMLDHLQGQFDEEVRLYRIVLKRKPQDPVALNNIAWSLSEGTHQPSEALDMIDNVIRLVGRDPNNIDTRGVILMRLGRLDEAIEELKWVVQAEPTGIHYYHLAHAYREAGRDAEFRAAREQMRRAGLTVADLDATEHADYQVLIGL
jgi:tetratricopeptide (TPR) repeat protein